MIDTRVHCLLYFLFPSGHGLKPLDLEVMRQLASKVNLLPVISKADSLTQTETKRLKARILEELRAAEIPTYQMDSEEQSNLSLWWEPTRWLSLEARLSASDSILASARWR